MCTGRIPAVPCPTAAPAASESRVRVTGSMSQKTGVAPSYSKTLVEATKVSGLVITSAPSPQPRALTPRWRAAVPLETATAYPSPSQSAKSCSNWSSFGPRESEPERTTSSSSSSSRSPSSGRASGIGSFTRCGSLFAWLECVLERVDKGLPRGLDDVLRDSDRAPFALTVGGVEEDAGNGAGAVVLVEDAHLVVGELDVGEVRVAIENRPAKRGVQRVDRSVALGRTQVALAVDPDLDRRLGDHLAVLALLDQHPEPLQTEERLVAAGLPAKEQLEGGPGGLIVVAAVLALLQSPKRLPGLLVVERNPGALRAIQHGSLAGELRDDHLPLVPYQ